MSRPEQERTVRLQKALAAAGIGSRRHGESLIAAGRVSVNGAMVTVQGSRVDPERDTVAVDGVAVPVAPGKVYLALHKPAGVLSAMSDASGRPCVGDLVPEEPRLFHVGRLDGASEGLLLLTNDGAFAQRLTHPSYGVAKTYLAEIRGPVAPGLARQLRAGVELDDGPVRVDACRVVGRSGRRTSVEVILHEGRNHVVRRLLAAVGYPVRRLVRTRIGPLGLGDLAPGRLRRLSLDEVRRLDGAAQATAPSAQLRTGKSTKR
jgi:23S rRNA pseudouridine2605 synthase